MILRLGVVMMACAAVLAAGVVVALAWGGEDTPARPVAAIASAPTPNSSEPDTPAVVPETPKPDTPAVVPETPEKPVDPPKPSGGKEAASVEKAAPAPVKAAPVQKEAWPEVEPAEVEAVRRPRSFELAPGAAMSLTVEDIGLYDAPVFDEESAEALDRGVIHIPETPMPWDADPQKNVYLAGHRLGYPGTGGRLVFYRLPELERGDEISLRDRDGTRYTYAVTETFTVDPAETWPVQPVRGRDILTLQTCVGPDYGKRLVVRADRLTVAGL